MPNPCCNLPAPRMAPAPAPAPAPSLREGSGSSSGSNVQGPVPPGRASCSLSQSSSLGQHSRTEAQRPSGSLPRTSRRHSHWASPSKLVALQA